MCTIFTDHEKFLLEDKNEESCAVRQFFVAHTQCNIYYHYDVNVKLSLLSMKALL